MPVETKAGTIIANSQINVERSKPNIERSIHRF